LLTKFGVEGLNLYKFNNLTKADSMSSTTSRLVLTLIDLAISGLVRMAPEFSKTSLERFLILRIETI